MGNDVEGNGRGVVNALFQHLSRKMGKVRKPYVRISFLQVEIRLRDVQNSRQSVASNNLCVLWSSCTFNESDRRRDRPRQFVIRKSG